MGKNRELQLFVHQFRDEAGSTDVDPRDLARWGIRHGYLELPEPVAPVDLLTKQIARTLHEETKFDPQTNRTYRVNHARPEFRLGKQVSIWGDIDKLEYDFMVKCFIQRRQQMVGDAVQLSNDCEHWNRVNPNSTAIQIELDFGLNILWSKNAPNELAS